MQRLMDVGNIIFIDATTLTWGDVRRSSETSTSYLKLQRPLACVVC